MSIILCAVCLVTSHSIGKCRLLQELGDHAIDGRALLDLAI